MAISLSQLRFADPSPAARRLLWHVLSIGEVSRDEPERHGGLDKSGLFLFQVLSGAGELEVGNSTHCLRPGKECWLVDLRLPRGYLPSTGKPLRTQGVRFNGPGVEAWLELLGQDPVFPLSKGFLGPHLQRLHRLMAGRGEDMDWQIHVELTAVWGTLLAQRGAFQAPRIRVPTPVARVLDAVFADPARDWHARELAAIAAISYSRLRYHFRRAQGESLHEFIQRTRLDLARQLLSDRRPAVKEVASRLHFSSESHFSRFFHQGTGMSPTQFRERCRT